jgi:hypothetical protein
MAKKQTPLCTPKSNTGTMFVWLFGQRQRASSGPADTLDRHVSGSIPSLGPQVVTVHDLEPLQGQEPQPEEKGHRVGLASVLAQPAECVHAGFLHDVRGIDPSLEPPIEPEHNRVAQAVMIPPEQLAPVLAVAGRDSPHRRHVFAGSGHGRHHISDTAQTRPFGTPVVMFFSSGIDRRAMPLTPGCSIASHDLVQPRF